MTAHLDERRLAAIYDSAASNVYAYAVRHCGRDAADDVLAETFLVAWRRLREIPDEPVAWLLGVARNVIRNHHRSVRRSDHLRAAVTASHTDDFLASDRLEMLEALSELSTREREALLLLAWDGLSVADAARVSGCTERAFRARVTRARANLSALLGDTNPTTRLEEELA